MNSQYKSWGRYPTARQTSWSILLRQDNLPPEKITPSGLPYGLGRSYGDVCLNDGGTLILTRALNHFISFDTENGILICEAGVSLDEILKLIVPQGWFLPVTPGTKFVTVGGAIANDVHGKNHHVAGSFGCFVTQFELLRSDGSRLLCTATENEDYYNATIGGMGLTGLITWARIKLIPIVNNRIAQKTIKFKRLEDFFELSNRLAPDYDYTVAWIDCLASGKSLGRGLFMAGNHATVKNGISLAYPQNQKSSSIPFDFPEFVLNNFSIKLFNKLYYHKQRRREKEKLTDFDSFFYPLDGINDWNRIYGKRGLLQYQCLVPNHDTDVIRNILKTISDSRQGSFLAVIKVMGDIPSAGMMSFPQPGITLALDFPAKESVFRLFKKLDVIVREAGGRLYPAKDSCMSAGDFQSYYPEWETFAKFIDPRFSSSFWRRVTNK
ncbi:MAG: FAD-binding oxidoreductase [candidate division Zixibacteria bacterium]